MHLSPRHVIWAGLWREISGGFDWSAASDRKRLPSMPGSTGLSRLERGLQNPTVAVLEKLARALSSNIEELFRAPHAAEAPSRSPA
jgi:transcriptional regulator with XRE-family HTH domain